MANVVGGISGNPCLHSTPILYCTCTLRLLPLLQQCSASGRRILKTGCCTIASGRMARWGRLRWV